MFFRGDGVLVLCVLASWTRTFGASGDEACPVLSQTSQPRRCANRIDPRMLRYDFEEIEFAMVADLDKKSRDPEKFLWHSFLKKGVLKRPLGQKNYTVEWGETLTLYSQTAHKNRSMELSELVSFDGKLLAMCDRTGLMFKLDHVHGGTYQRQAIVGGNGDISDPFKTEWATAKDGVLLVGSIGREYTRTDGTIKHTNSEWVKAIDRNGKIENYNWDAVYMALRHATNTTPPGYLWHEAIDWDPRHRRWVIAPRKESVGLQYHADHDETRGTNLVLVASEDFSQIDVKRIGLLDMELGVTAIRKIPGQEATYVAIKAKERLGMVKSYLTVFNLNGEFLIDPPLILLSNDYKYEGLDFLTSVTPLKRSQPPGTGLHGRK